MLVNVNLSKIKRFGNSFRRRSSNSHTATKVPEKKIVKKYITFSKPTMQLTFPYLFICGHENYPHFPIKSSLHTAALWHKRLKVPPDRRTRVSDYIQ